MKMWAVQQHLVRNRPDKHTKRRTEMATTAAEAKSNKGSDLSKYESEIRNDMAELKKDIAALTKTMGEYGKARADDLQGRASDWSDEMLAESRRTVKKLGKQVSRLEKDMEAQVREHPLQWFLGALGLGLMVTILMRRNHD
ncbi:hypothetical protein MUY35_16905 [Aliiroseovarius sp. S1339]|uniref:DUF883 family protein n=1 Tax=Aliiroseovarius sp. S1339 TaxID=2936990 RepID=UPI0020BD9A90|nr:hypothetical protein [Aliiroseovarius sp. S1339]MCK8465542.1 hypothetical protein [Aliiroseovarius sp. S1339]